MQVQIEAALIREQGVEFAVVAVRPSVLSSSSECGRVATSFESVFGGLPVVLAAASNGRYRFWGRPDLVRFLSRVGPGRLPWRRFRVADG